MTTEPKWQKHFQRFTEVMSVRLQQGYLDYGDESFDRPDPELANEVEEELLDIIGWTFIRLVKHWERNNADAEV